MTDSVPAVPPGGPGFRPWVPRLLALLVTLAGVALVVTGLQRTSAFGEPAALVGRMPRTTGPVVVTALGMTELRGSTVRIRAVSAPVTSPPVTSSGGSPSARVPVFIGVGRAEDVDAYLGGAARVEISGLDSQGALRLSDRPGEKSLPDPSGADVWAASVRVDGVATLTWPRTPGRWRAVIATDGVTPPSAVELTWSGVAGTSPAPAMLAIGAVLFVVGGAGFLAMRSGRLFAGPSPSVVAPEGPTEPAPRQTALPSRRDVRPQRRGRGHAAGPATGPLTGPLPFRRRPADPPEE